MESMFSYAESFNQPLNNWNTSHVTNMSGMFYRAEIFNQTLNNLDVSNFNRYAFDIRCFSI